LSHRVFLRFAGAAGGVAGGHQADLPRLQVKKFFTLRAAAISRLRKKPSGPRRERVMDAACEATKLSGTAIASTRQRLDETLLASIAAGDKFAMQVLFQRHNVRVYRFVLRLLGNASVAEEIVGDVFLNVWRHAASFQGKCSVTTWLLTIARHKTISVLRRRSETQLDDEIAATIADPGDDAETVLDREDRGKMIRECLKRLSPSHREIIDLVYYHEKSVEEVAQIVGAPKSTVKTRMFYARSHMAKLLAAAGLHRA
jgi:RNA polymerase sigma-70 factor (ECF subfamily)